MCVEIQIALFKITTSRLMFVISLLCSCVWPAKQCCGFFALGKAGEARLCVAVTVARNHSGDLLSPDMFALQLTATICPQIAVASCSGAVAKCSSTNAVIAVDCFTIDVGACWCFHNGTETSVGVVTFSARVGVGVDNQALAIVWLGHAS